MSIQEYKERVQTRPDVVSGANLLRETAERLAQQGWVKPLILTHTALVQTRVYGELRAALISADHRVVETTGDESTPELLEALLGKLGGGDHDCLLAFGGAGVIDAAKLLKAVLAGQGRELPLVVIPTVPAGDAPVSVMARLHDDKAAGQQLVVDPALLPDLVLLDEQLTDGLTDHLQVMDTLGRAIEAFICNWHAPVTESLAMSAVRVAMNNLREARRNADFALNGQALASQFQELSLTCPGFLQHMARGFSQHHGIPFALAQAMVLPHALEHSLQHCQSRLASLAVSTGLGVSLESEAMLAQKLITQLHELNQAFGVSKILSEADWRQLVSLARPAGLEQAAQIVSLDEVQRWLSRAQLAA